MKGKNVGVIGSSKIQSGDYNNIEVTGNAKIMGDTTFVNLEVNGTCKCYGSMEGDIAQINGAFNCDGDLRVGSLEINGTVKTGNTKVYADRIEVNGFLSNDDEISADYIVIDGCTKAQDIVGDHIVINYRYLSKFTRKFMGFILIAGLEKKEANCANNIECSKLEAQRIHCRKVAAHEIVLHSDCVIDEITCDGSLRYDRSCQINKIIGECSITIED